MSTQNNNNNVKLNELLSYAIIIYNEYIKMQKIKKNPPSNFEPMFSQSTIQKENPQFFLINKEYIDKIKLILNFNEIEQILRKNPHINTNNFNNTEITKLKNLLKQNSITFLDNIDQMKNENYLNDNKLYKIPTKEHISNYQLKLFYCKNCQLINKEIIKVIKQIDQKFTQKIQRLNCIYSNNKIIVVLDNNILNAGYYDDNCIFIPENIIFNNDENRIKIIYEYIVKNGFNSLNKLVNNNLILINLDNSNTIGVPIEKILEGSNSLGISIKLKSFILLSIFMQKNHYNSLNIKKTFEPFYLINKNWLEQYEFEEIYNLIKNNNNIR